MRRLGFLLSLIFVSFGLVSVIQAEEISFRGFTKLSGQTEIQMIDLVDAENLSPATISLLRSIRLAEAPKLGEQRVFTAQFITEVLRSKFSSSQTKVRVPNQVTVVNRGFEISEDLLRSELISKWQRLCVECRLTIDSIRIPAMPVALMNRPWRLDVKAELPKGQFTERLLVEGHDGQTQLYWLNGQVSVQKKVPVATRTLSAGVRLAAMDFKFEWRDVTFATDGALAASEMLGQESKMVVPAGQIIWAHAIVRAKAVKRGDLVRVSTGTDGWQVILQAITEQDGYIGDRVNIRNPQTKKVIAGEVTGPGEVVVR